MGYLVVAFGVAGVVCILLKKYWLALGFVAAMGFTGALMLFTHVVTR